MDLARTARLIVVATPMAVAALMLAPGVASASIGCSLTPGPGLLTITEDGFEDVAALYRIGAEIRVVNDETVIPLTCAGGTPEISNVDTILVSAGAGAVAPAIYIDLYGGALSLGMTPEPSGISEIELELDWPAGLLGIGGRRRDDRFRFGDAPGPLGRLNSDGDVDIDLGDTYSVLIRGQRGDDVIDAAAFGTPTSVHMNVLGGPGADRITGGRRADILSGESGPDRITGGRGRDDLTPLAGSDRIDAGPGRDTVDAAGGGHDRINCGPGEDRFTADPADHVRNCEVRIE